MSRKIKNIVVQEETKIGDPMKTEESQESIQKEIDLSRIELENTKREIEETKQSLKNLQNREYSQREIEISEKQVSMSHEKTTLKDKIEKQRIRDSELVTGRFMNRRAPGQPVKLPYLKHSTDPVKWYPLEDGKVYTIPRGFADQLNGGTDDDPCYYTPKFTQKQGDMDPDKPQSAIHSVDSSNKKYAFVAMGY